ncbi:hypothetical protein CVT25_008057 [Psilocybe cyanescens]|uniref:Uncharacterized protein n=1 Tax=Psilocybe cyanescens TaxID=93625 RepID=A0A409XG62_PSICY|nr:hypothetical protein CVT25_008057 [Psilocybe cyanescens]
MLLVAQILIIVRRIPQAMVQTQGSVMIKVSSETQGVSPSSINCVFACMPPNHLAALPANILPHLPLFHSAFKNDNHPKGRKVPTKALFSLENDSDKGKSKEKTKGKGKGNRGDMKGTELAAMLAKMCVRVDNSMSRSGAALAPAFNLALADITAEDVACWKTLNEILPLLEDQIEKLEVIVDKNSWAFNKSQQHMKKNVDVILSFDGEIGQLFDAMGDMQEQVASDLAAAPNVHPTFLSTTANILSLTTDLPSGAGPGPGPGPDPYLYDSSNAAPLTNENVNMEHLVATIATPTMSTSSGDMLSLPVALYSPEENKRSSPLLHSPSPIPTPSSSNSESQQPIVITRRPTPISPLHGQGNLINHNTSDKMDVE